MAVDLSPAAERARARVRLLVRLGIAGSGCALLLALGAGQAHAHEASTQAGPLGRVAAKLSPTVELATTRARAAARRATRPAARSRAPRALAGGRDRHHRPALVNRVERRLRVGAGTLAEAAPTATGTVLAALDAVVVPVPPGPPAPAAEPAGPRRAPPVSALVSAPAPGAAVVAAGAGDGARVAPASGSSGVRGVPLTAAAPAGRPDADGRQLPRYGPWLPTLPAATVGGGPTGGLGLLVVVLAGALLLAGPAGGRPVAPARAFGATRAPRPRTLPG